MPTVSLVVYAILIEIYPTVYTYNIYTSVFLTGCMQGYTFSCFLHMLCVHTWIKGRLVLSKFSCKDGHKTGLNKLIKALTECSAIWFLWVRLWWHHVLLLMFILDVHIQTPARTNSSTLARAHIHIINYVMISGFVVSVGLDLHYSLGLHVAKIKMFV